MPVAREQVRMDSRVGDHAEVLVDWSARIEAGDDVVISVSVGGHDLAVAVARQLGEREANLLSLYDSAEVERAYLRAAGEFAADPQYERELLERADAVLRLGGGRTTTALADVPAETKQAYRRVREGVREAASRPTGCRRCIPPDRSPSKPAWPSRSTVTSSTVRSSVTGGTGRGDGPAEGDPR